MFRTESGTIESGVGAAEAVVADTTTIVTAVAPAAESL